LTVYILMIKTYLSKLKILAISDEGFLWRSFMKLDFKECDREVK
jgi:hypothetical protein